MTRPRKRHVTVLSRRGCHLCAEACAEVARIAADVGASWEERDITDDPELMADHADQVPVILVDGRPHDFWRVDETRLRAALAG